MPFGVKSPDRKGTPDSEKGYGSIPLSEEEEEANTASVEPTVSNLARSVEEAEAEEGPFPVSIKSMLIAEAFGTCTYVQMGLAANCIALYTSTMVGYWQTGMVWAIALTIAIYLSAPLSGGHLNPAISFAMALARPADLRFRRLWPYWMTQLAGAVVGATINLVVFHRAISRFEKKHEISRGSTDSIASAAAFGDYYSLNHKYVKSGVHAFFIEMFGAAVLGFVVFTLTNPRNPIPGSFIPIVIGLTYGVLVATLGPLTGGSFNPARDFAPRLVTWAARWGASVSFKDFLPYLVGPMVGAPVGAFLADKVLML